MGTQVIDPRRDSLVFCLATILFGSLAYAGGGPENVFLVVNPRHRDSLTIANHFVQLRQIPASAVFYLSWPPDQFTTDIRTFREQILQPILKEIERRQLADQVDYIVYSSAFPYAVNFQGDFPALRDPHPWASITALTYFHRAVLSRDASFRGPQANRYSQTQLNGPSRGYRSRYSLDTLGLRSETGGKDNYYLSMMLGYTTGERNNTVGQVVNYLTRGKQADFTYPAGTIYFVRNDNIRSQVRHNKYADTVSQLRQLKVKAEIVEGSPTTNIALPVKKTDVMGVTTGYFEHFWGLSESTILPGAICENFTSYGGVLQGTPSKQSLLCNFLQHGAVASSGTVAEPFAVAAKFPDPILHVHYARGCSVAEAYYQAVASPYQLLIVGDPLCQPWGDPPQFTVGELPNSDPVAGIVTLTAKAEPSPPIRYFEVFVDGRRVAQALPQDPLGFDTRLLADGFHELRVVAVADTEVETQGRVISSFTSFQPPSTTAAATADRSTTDTARSAGDVNPAQTALHDNAKVETSQLLTIKTKIEPSTKLLVHQNAIVSVTSRDAKEVRIYVGRDLLGKVDGEGGKIPINLERLGSGPVRLQAVALPKTPRGKPVFGEPFWIKIETPPAPRNPESSKGK